MKMQKRFKVSIVIVLSLLFNTELHAQSKWSKYIGVYFTGDAEMYYTGPSIVIGSDFQLSKDISIGFYGQYFEKDFGDHGYRAGTVAIVGHLYLGRK